MWDLSLEPKGEYCVKMIEGPVSKIEGINGRPGRTDTQDRTQQTVGGYWIVTVVVRWNEENSELNERDGWESYISTTSATMYYRSIKSSNRPTSLEVLEETVR